MHPISIEEFAEMTVKANQAKEEILALFSEEPGDGYTWSEQDIWEQSRKIIDRWNRS